MKNVFAVFGFFSSRGDVRKVVEALKLLHLENNDISVLRASSVEREKFYYENPSKASQGAIIGAISIATLGALLGWFVGLGVIDIPGITPFITASPVISALAGAGFGSIFGGLAGALVGAGVPKYKYVNYGALVRGGKILLSAHVKDRKTAAQARRILETHGADNVKTAREESDPTRSVLAQISGATFMQEVYD